MPQSDLAVILMAKLPRVGQVKTRLQTRFSPEQATAVYRTFLLHLAGRLGRWRGGQVVIAFDPPDHEQEMRSLVGPVLEARYCPQCQGDLGQRLAHVSGNIGKQVPRMLFLGVDSPDVPLDHLQQAADLTRSVEVSVSRTADGGYWSLGLRSSVDASRLLNDIPWSSGREAEATLDRARQLGHSTATGPPWEDVDVPADMDRLLARLRDSDTNDDRALREQLGTLIDGAR